MAKYKQRHKNTGYEVDADKLRNEDSVRQRKDRHANESKIADLADEMLAEIDAVLEDNAEEFVAKYVQKGGQ